MNSKNLAQMIDHTLLKAEATKDELIKICEEAMRYNFATVCVNSCNISLVAELLKGSTVKPIAVVGFPLGANLSCVKVFEAQEAIKLGAKEIDMVINIGALKAGDLDTVYSDILEVVEGANPYPVKVIIEIASLTREEKIVVCELAKKAGAAFVKTSTGFGKGGATVEDVALMRKTVGSEMGVKASGGVRDKATAEAMISAGASRIGASASVAIVTETKGEGGGY